MKRARDFQKSKVYVAETDAGLGQRILKVDEIQAWIDQITGTRWWRSRCYIEKLRVFDGRGTRKAYGGYFGLWHSGKRGWGISMPRWSRYQLYILHELAHILIDQVRDTTVPHHGREFCRHLLALVGRWMGRDHVRLLRAAFRARGVKWHRKRTG
jgi:putative metallohydrolase (TIGR04338 family)